MDRSFDYRDVDLVRTEVVGGLAVAVAAAAVAAVAVAEPAVAAVIGLDVAVSASAPCNAASIPCLCSQEHPLPYPRRLWGPCMEVHHPVAIHVIYFVRFCAALIEVLLAGFSPPPVSVDLPPPWR